MEPTWAWRVLGLTPGASPDDVRRAFRVTAQLLHPDRAADLGDDVRREAQRRMAELVEAYRVCTAVSQGLPPPPPRAHRETESDHGPLQQVGGQATELLDSAVAELATVAPFEAYRLGQATTLEHDENAAASRRIVQLLTQIADAWPGTAEGDRARALLVTSAAARNVLSARERAGHLVLVVDAAARDAAWDQLEGRDELSVAQIVYAHPTVADPLRRRARTRLAELGDWATIADDPDPDIREAAAVQLLLQEAQLLAERATWLSRRERVEFDTDHGGWLARVDAVLAGEIADHLQRDLRDAADAIRAALPLRTGR